MRDSDNDWVDGVQSFNFRKFCLWYEVRTGERVILNSWAVRIKICARTHVYIIFSLAKSAYDFFYNSAHPPWSVTRVGFLLCVHYIRYVQWVSLMEGVAADTTACVESVHFIWSTAYWRLSSFFSLGEVWSNIRIGTEFCSLSDHLQDT